jgi:hypothetical protein
VLPDRKQLKPVTFWKVELVKPCVSMTSEPLIAPGLQEPW